MSKWDVTINMCDDIFSLIWFLVWHTCDTFQMLIPLPLKHPLEHSVPTTLLFCQCSHTRSCDGMSNFQLRLWLFYITLHFFALKSKLHFSLRFRSFWFQNVRQLLNRWRKMTIGFFSLSVFSRLAPNQIEIKRKEKEKFIVEKMENEAWNWTNASNGIVGPVVEWKSVCKMRMEWCLRMGNNVNGLREGRVVTKTFLDSISKKF